MNFATWSGLRLTLFCGAYVLVTLVATWFAMAIRVRDIRRTQPDGDLLFSFGLPKWWLALLIVPPILLIASWILTSGRR